MQLPHDFDATLLFQNADINTHFVFAGAPIFIRPSYAKVIYHQVTLKLYILFIDYFAKEYFSEDVVACSML